MWGTYRYDHPIIIPESFGSKFACEPSSHLMFSATNAENMKLNEVKSQLTGEYGAVPDTARQYKVREPASTVLRLPC